MIKLVYGSRRQDAFEHQVANTLSQDLEKEDIIGKVLVLQETAHQTLDPVGVLQELVEADRHRI